MAELIALPLHVHVGQIIYVILLFVVFNLVQSTVYSMLTELVCFSSLLPIKLLVVCQPLNCLSSSGPYSCKSN